MGFFQRIAGAKEEANSKDVQEAGTVGVVIQFLPYIIYMYVSEDDYVCLDDGGNASMESLDGSYIGATGHLIALELSNMAELEDVKQQYGLNELNIPIKIIPVREY